MIRSIVDPIRVAGLLLSAMACFAISPKATQVAAAAEDTTMATAAEMIRFSGSPGGMAAIVGPQDASLALALAKQGTFTVQCLVTDDDKCQAARNAVGAQGVYGTVSVDTLDSNRLHYTNNLLNLVVIDSQANHQISVSEVLRVMAPLGTAWLHAASQDDAQQLQSQFAAVATEDLSIVDHDSLWVRFTKPWPKDIDQWSHFLHGADGNPVARDRVVGPPQHYQWVAGPMWLRSHETDSSICTMVTAAGRLFFIVDEAPISLAGDHELPDKWSLVARDAFNGVDLWRVPIRRWGWREWKHTWFNTRPGDVPLNIQKRLVATAEAVYATLGYHVPVSQLDARTGEVLQTYEETNPTGEVLHLDGTLILSRFTGPVDDDGLTAYTGAQVMAVDAESGKTLWTSDKSYRGSIVDYVRWRAMHGNSKRRNSIPLSIWQPMVKPLP